MSRREMWHEHSPSTDWRDVYRVLDVEVRCHR
jgi:hypothetical protein